MIRPYESSIGANNNSPLPQKKFSVINFEINFVNTLHLYRLKTTMKRRVTFLLLFLFLGLTLGSCKGKKPIPANSVRFPVTTDAMQNTRPGDVNVDVNVEEPVEEESDEPARKEKKSDRRRPR